MDTDFQIKQVLPGQKDDASDREVWRVGDLIIDVGLAAVERDGEELQVTGLTFDLLVALGRPSVYWSG
jgi:DNA-binding response OmpR family regulator